MDANLLRVLVAKKFFVPGTEVDATYRGVDMSGSAIVRSSGTFTITAIRPIGDVDIALEGASTRDGTKRAFFGQTVTQIGGMDPIRFAASCGIDEFGEKIKEGKRRGRKPKNRVVEPEEIDDEDDLLDEIFGTAE